MYKRIIVPLDGSILAEQVLPYVKPIAKAFKAKVELLRIAEPFSSQVIIPDPGLFYNKLIEDMRIGAAQYLKDLETSIRKDGITVSSSVKEGSPAEEIVKLAGKESSTIIAMSAHGRSGVARWLLGSVTTKILHTTVTPVLVIHPKTKGSVEIERKLSSIVVPLDGSAFAEQSLQHASALATSMGLEVIIAQVVPSEILYEGLPHISKMDSKNILKVTTQKAESYLNGVATKLRRQGVKSLTKRVPIGYPASSIIDISKGPGTMVIMTTRGKSGSDSWLLGSTADRVIRQSGNPVLVIRPQGKV